MELFDKIILTIHVAVGFASLLSFLIPVIVKKGSKIHRKVGWIYVYSMWVVVVTAIILSVNNALQGRYILTAFLGMLALITACPLWYGISILKYKKEVPLSYVKKRRAFESILFILGVLNVGVSIYMNLKGDAVLLLIFGLLAMTAGFNVFPGIKKLQGRANWYRDHLQGMLSAGIAAYTAFFAFGGYTFFSEIFTGALVAIPWSAPSVIGAIFINRLKRKHKALEKRQAAKKLALAIAFIVCFSSLGNAQLYVEGGNTRHRFAQMNISADFKYFPASGKSVSFIAQNSMLVTSAVAANYQARLMFAGTHFWGHAEFFVGIPVYSSSENFISSAETGLKIFPWKLKHKRLSPFVGASWFPYEYKQEGGPSLVKSDFPILGGLSYTYKNHQLELQAGALINRTHDYYISRTEIARIQIPSHWFTIGYKYILDTTISAEKNWENGKVQAYAKNQGKKLNGFTVSAGPSSATFLRPSSYIENEVPFVQQHKFSDLFFDFGVGYYLHNPDIHIGLAYRNISKKIDAYDYEQSVQRRSIGIEAYKFIADYHGFVPYLGIILSYENLNMKDSDNEIILNESTHNTLKPGLVFGWDIRPNRIQSFILRTNLRYTPNLNLSIKEGININFDQLEFNFIQLVIFPGRMF